MSLVTTWSPQFFTDMLNHPINFDFIRKYMFHTSNSSVSETPVVTPIVSESSSSAKLSLTHKHASSSSSASGPVKRRDLLTQFEDD